MERSLVKHVKGKENAEICGNTKTNKKDSFLEKRIKSLLEKYENDDETKRKIFGELQTYQINLTIARELKDKITEKNLTKNIIQFLNQFLRKVEEKNYGSVI